MRLSIARVSADGDTARNDGDGFDVAWCAVAPHAAGSGRRPDPRVHRDRLRSGEAGGCRHRVRDRRSDRVGRQWNHRRLQPHDGTPENHAQRWHRGPLQPGHRVRFERRPLRDRRLLRVGYLDTGQISEFSPTGQPMPAFATGLSNPFSLVFDNSGNLYVGQQGTPTSPSSTRRACGSPTSASSRRERPVMTGSTWPATSAPSTTRQKTRTSTATTSAPTPNCRISTSPRSPVTTPTRSASSPTARYW